MASLRLSGQETFTIRGLDKLAPRAKVRVQAMSPGGDKTTFDVLARVDDATDSRIRAPRRNPSAGASRADRRGELGIPLRNIERGADTVPGPKTAPAR